MALITLGNRDDLERAIRKLIPIPLAIIGAFVLAGLLKDYVPAFLAFVVGGALGGGIGYFVGEGAVKLLQLAWPTKSDEP